MNLLILILLIPPLLCTPAINVPCTTHETCFDCLESPGCTGCQETAESFECRQQSSCDACMAVGPEQSRKRRLGDARQCCWTGDLCVVFDSSKGICGAKDECPTGSTGPTTKPFELNVQAQFLCTQGSMLTDPPACPFGYQRVEQGNLCLPGRSSTSGGQTSLSTVTPPSSSVTSTAFSSPSTDPSLTDSSASSTDTPASAGDVDGTPTSVEDAASSTRSTTSVALETLGTAGASLSEQAEVGGKLDTTVVVLVAAAVLFGIVTAVLVLVARRRTARRRGGAPAQGGKVTPVRPAGRPSDRRVHRSSSRSLHHSSGSPYATASSTLYGTQGEPYRSSFATEGARSATTNQYDMPHGVLHY